MAKRRSTDRATPADRFGGAVLRRALDETRIFIARPRFWVLIGSGIALTAFTGPFYTIHHLGPGVRTLYWTPIILTAALLQTFFTMLVRRVFARWWVRGGLYWALAATLATLASLPVVYALTWVLNLRLIGAVAVEDPLKLGLYVALPMLLINLVVNASLSGADQAPETQGETDAGQGPDLAPADFAPRFEAPQYAPPRLVPAPPPPEAEPEPEPDSDSDVTLPATPPLLFDKLPPELGRDLICLRAQDHYVEAHTPAGSAQVLMRLSDAERDLGHFDGMRVHRSWWVNLDHVSDFARTEAGGMALTTANGLSIPVSRGQRAALREALEQRRRAAE